MKLNNKINKIVFIGMGLINSSLARDLKKYNFYNTSIAYSRRASTREKIKNLNLVDVVESDCKKAVIDADLIIIGVPVDSYEAILKKIITYIKPGAIITDVGSVKKEVIKRVSKIIPTEISFVPGHPIAGTEKSGPESGFSGLFKDGWCILTPGNSVKKKDINILILNKENLIGYNLLRKRNYYLVENKTKKRDYYYFDTLIVRKEFRKKNLSKKILNKSISISKKSNLPLILICKKQHVSFYKKFSFKLLKKNNIKFADHKFNSYSMIYAKKNTKNLISNKIQIYLT